jgi:hypothetical protein
MPGLIIAGVDREVEGLIVRNWFDEPKLRLKSEDMVLRPLTWIRAIVLHTSKGIPGGKDKRPQKILEGFGPDTNRDVRMAQMWAEDDRHAGAHLVCDHDGTFGCLADLVHEAPFHAGRVNKHTIGIEMYQGGDAELYKGQLENVVKMVDFLTRCFGIQRQIHMPYLNRPLTRLKANGEGVVGVYGHRDCSNRRGRGDPGDSIMEMLVAAGYEVYNMELEEDVKIWKGRQLKLGITADGIPGPETVKALKKAGKKHGIMIERSGD